MWPPSCALFSTALIKPALVIRPMTLCSRTSRCNQIYMTSYLDSDLLSMSWQIRINPEQTFLLNILWKDQPEDKLKCTGLLTVTYGTINAPILATRVLQEIAITNSAEYPLASNALLYQKYCDVLSDGDDLNKLQSLYDELASLL